MTMPDLSLFMPLKKHLSGEKFKHIAVLIGILCLLAAPLLLTVNDTDLADSPNSSTNLELPIIDGDWFGPYPVMDNWQPKMIGADLEAVRAYKSNQFAPISLYIGYYFTEAQSKELININNDIVDGINWHRAYIDEDIPKTNRAPIIETVIKSADNNFRIVWHWYRIAGRTTSNHLSAKLLRIWDIITENKGSAIVSISTTYNNDIKASRESLMTFREEYENNINAVLDDFR
ncbi:MAG: EpsI family protein [Candidatus Thiodiazotropha sp. (ex Epidulcina cf. delphinae)]|nr:EpsI family protein [Candidatus Thiodiazotropha sp. (ex Epidulcina cf. delphinae)]